MNFLDGKAILITGGTGSLGNALVSEIYRRCPKARRVVIFSRDELKQYEMRQKYPEDKFPGLRFFLGDVRDRQRLARALDRIDFIIHAAALKQVPAAEYNPMEFVHTNILGAENVVETAIDSNVQAVVALSTDKAAAPINLYGATKLCSDKIFVAANEYAGSRFRSSVVRYGNVMGSRGSVIPMFLDQKRKGRLTITDPEMTRFNMSLDDGVSLVLWALENAVGGEILVPKAPSYRLMDLAEAIAGKGCEKEFIGIRPGEKIHEEMITQGDSPNTIDIGEYFAVLPIGHEGLAERYLSTGKGERVAKGFTYSSDKNPEFLSVKQLRALIRAHVDASGQNVE